MTVIFTRVVFANVWGGDFNIVQALCTPDCEPAEREFSNTTHVEMTVIMWDISIEDFSLGF